MFEEEDSPKKTQTETFPRKLEGLSIEVLKAYLVDLDREKARVQHEIAQRQTVRGAAEDVFKKS